jgi:acetyl esterase
MGRLAAGTPLERSTTMSVEAKTQRFLDDLKALGGPPLQARPIPEARQFLDDAQAHPAHLAPAGIEPRTLQAGPTGEIRLVVVRPENAVGPTPALLYLHGGGWILGNWRTHERLVRELASAIPATVVFVDYAPSPEQAFPVAIEQAYEALRWMAANAEELSIDPMRLAIAGDSAGGAVAAAVTLMAKERGGPAIRAQVLFYPVTDADFETPSYRAFAEVKALTRDAMRWFWDAYVPDPAARRNPLAAPLQASLEQLSGLPPALVITGENDVLRDEGEAYAHKLMDAGVRVTAVRYLGTVHDFVMLNALADTSAAVSATAQAVGWLRDALNATIERQGQPGPVTMMPPEPASLPTRSPA